MYREFACINTLMLNCVSRFHADLNATNYDSDPGHEPTYVFVREPMLIENLQISVVTTSISYATPGQTNVENDCKLILSL